MNHPPWLGSSWLLAVPETHECVRKEGFLGRWGHSIICKKKWQFLTVTEALKT
jgi:hypothetical protein